MHEIQAFDRWTPTMTHCAAVCLGLMYALCPALEFDGNAASNKDEKFSFHAYIRSKVSTLNVGRVLVEERGGLSKYVRTLAPPYRLGLLAPVCCVNLFGRNWYKV